MPVIVAPQTNSGGGGGGNGTSLKVTIQYECYINYLFHFHEDIFSFINLIFIDRCIIISIFIVNVLHLV